MRIARFFIRNRPVVAISEGDGFLDFGAIVEARGFRSEVADRDPDTHLIRMLKRGMLDEEYIKEQLNWVKIRKLDFKLDTKGLPPLLPLRPGKIVCLARNYAAHAKESGHEPPPNAVYFAKTENCAIGHLQPFVLPEELGRIDHEGELGVVISKVANKVQASHAGEYILGYTIVNDITARAFQKELGAAGMPWYAAKSLDGSAPIGPWIVSPSQFEPLDGKRITVKVNGEIRQDGVLDDMIWKVPQLIELISRYITLYPGDIISTGTPSGVSPLKKGDEVIVEIDGLGMLKTPIE